MLTVCRKTTPELKTRKPERKWYGELLSSFSSYWVTQTSLNLGPEEAEWCRCSRSSPTPQVPPWVPPASSSPPAPAALHVRHMSSSCRRLGSALPIYSLADRTERLLFHQVNCEPNFCSNSFCKRLDLTFSCSTLRLLCRIGNVGCWPSAPP